MPNPPDRPHSSGVTARLRGVSAVSDRVAWASGSGSTVLRTADGGATWQKLTVTTDAVDFRDIDAIDARDRLRPQHRQRSCVSHLQDDRRRRDVDAAVQE